MINEFLHNTDMQAATGGGEGWEMGGIAASSIVDPDTDLDGSETFSRIRIRKKSFRIRAAPYPK
jgi:hypothetical protein